jgi:hypothetical protein
LDLSVDNDYVVDTNTIEDVIDFGSDNHDKEVFLIHHFENSPGAYRATSTDVFGIGAYWYNEAYTNKEILARYIDYLTGALVLYSLYDGLNLFLYEGNVPSGILLPQQTPTYLTFPTTAGTGFPLNDLIYDPFNRINTGNERFTPVDEGVYQFCVGMSIDDWPTCPSGIIVSVHLVIEHYNSADTLLNRYLSDVRTHVTRLSNPIYETWTSPWIPMDSGDYCVFVIDYAQNLNPGVSQAQITFGGSAPAKQYFQCCASRVAIQDVQTNLGNDRRISKTAFDFPVPLDEFMNYLNDTTKSIRVQNQRINRAGTVHQIKYRFNDGGGNFEIISTDA